MKLTSILLFAACLQVSARTYSQTVSFSEKNAPLEKVFGIIERQTGYTFYYKVELLRQARNVFATCNNMDLEQALQVIFRDQPLAYNIVDRNIVISEKKMPVDKTSGIAPSAPPVLRGRITDSLGNPVAGASIIVKGSNRTVMSADDGSFEIKNIDPQSVLVISSVGYRTNEIAVAGRTYISVLMRQQTDKLSELTVVSTGYQRIRQYQMTGAVAVLSEKEYDQRVAVTGNFLESLEGKIPGLVYNSQSGELSIRGVATFNAVKQPLIIVDGFPTEINLLTINPNDIVSVNVLRDAAASAIYGVRASNGVIVVETRRGKSGKAQFNLRATTAMQSKPDFAYLNYAPAAEYAQLEASMITTANQGSLLNFYASSGYTLSPVQTVMNNKYLGT
ncbi:MAG: TonB-dependent receptor plug domain-containing protein, partial [Bacteroidetes bacterium]|nr:TonB-dependent receptor plug domain-containing protein [Bacteroidota bacterium]